MSVSSMAGYVPNDYDYSDGLSYSQEATVVFTDSTFKPIYDKTKLRMIKHSEATALRALEYKVETLKTIENESDPATYKQVFEQENRIYQLMRSACKKIIPSETDAIDFFPEATLSKKYETIVCNLFTQIFRLAPKDKRRFSNEMLLKHYLGPNSFVLKEKRVVKNNVCTEEYTLFFKNMDPITRMYLKLEDLNTNQETLKEKGLDLTSCKFDKKLEKELQNWLKTENLKIEQSKSGLCTIS